MNLFFLEDQGENEGECEQLEKENLELEEQNNLLRLRIEMLLDMVTDHCANVQTLEKRLDGMDI